MGRVQNGTPLARTGRRTQQGRTVLARQRPEREAVGAVERGQRRAAGDDHRAAGTGRQQRADLGGGRDVVQDHERAGRREQGPQQRGCGVRVFGDVPGFGPEVAQQGGERLGRGERGHAGGGAMQVEVELPIGETFLQGMCEVQRERALAYAGHTAEDDDPTAAGKRAVEEAQGLDATGEVGGRGRQLRRSGA